MPLTTYTPATAPAYCSSDDVRTEAERWSTSSTEEAARITAMILTASRWVDDQTNRWFYLRHLAITTQAPADFVQRLFLPAPVVGDLDAVTEDDVDLDLDDVLIYPSALEKRAQAPVSWPGSGQSNSWSQQQQAIVVEGYFGYDAVPAGIKKLTAHVTATMLGLATRAYVTGDGVTKAILEGKTLPDWAGLTLQDYTRPSYHGQEFMLEDIT